MSARNYRLFLLAGLVSAAAAGCEITKVDCDKTPDEDICQDDPEDDGGDDWPDEEDAGKADAGKTDAGKTDAGKADAGTSSEAGAGSDASSDGAASGDANAFPLTIESFCMAQFATAVAWRDELEGLCGSTKEPEARKTFLSKVLAYAADDAEGKCIATFKASVDSGNTTFDGTKAQACADAFLASFARPPEPFPTDGIDLVIYEAKIAHGAPVLAQISACRATFKGKLARDKVCADNVECLEGLRCLPAPGGTTTCQPPLTIGTCERTSNCADGYTCVGSTAGGGRTCVKSDALPLMGGNCTLSFECGEGLICSANKCANPPAVAQVICKP